MPAGVQAAALQNNEEENPTGLTSPGIPLTASEPQKLPRMPQRYDSFVWTPITGWKSRLSAGWVQIEYEQSLSAPLKRPLIRFRLAQSDHIVPGQAPLFGKGVSLCRVPRGTRAIEIAHGPEPEFAYRVTRHRPINVLSLVPRALRNNASLALQAIGAVFIGAEREHEQALGFARGGIPFSAYHDWRETYWRDVAPSDLDAALLPKGAQPRFGLYFPSNDTAQIAVAQQALDQQPGADYRLLVAHDTEIASGTRIGKLPPNPGVGDVLAASLGAQYIGLYSPEIFFAPAALAQVARAFSAAPEAGALYGDEDAVDAEGRYHTPLLKPDWSPLLESQRPYLGSGVFWRAQTLSGYADLPAAEMLACSPTRQRALVGLGPYAVGHIRRILVTHKASPDAMLKAHEAGTPLPRPASEQHKAAIIIANKNRLNLLKPCIDSIFEKSSCRAFEIIIVDNGSTEPDVLAYYKTLTDAGRAHVLSAPGPFNFSAMSNLGARHSTAPWFIFLNNDMEVLAQDWVEQLHQHVMKPDVGTVGARLLFPNGLIQHAGVAVGIGGFADHLHHSAPGDAPGYLGRLSVSHELSACTGACLALTREKFDAVGGFNETDLPVELNDIDLCLKLAERGWKTVFEPRALLIHHQSASRGRALLPFSRYNGERAYFRAHWLDAVRDDAYFHPALSEYAVTPALAG